MTPADLLDEFSIKIYQPPLSNMREDGRIRDTSNRVSALMLVVDFDTEVAMNGINNFIGNSTGRFADETVVALKAIGAQTQAELLDRILTVAKSVGMTHEAIQQDRSAFDTYAITSFNEMHGDKWNAASAEIDEIESKIDYYDLRSCAENYVQQHFAEIQKALGIAQV